MNRDCYAPRLAMAALILTAAGWAGCQSSEPAPAATARSEPAPRLSRGSEAMTDAQRTEAMRKANIIFTGTVTQVGTASVEGVPKSSNNIVLRVDWVHEKPDAVELSAGELVTVLAKDAAALPVGTRVTMYTDGWIFGQGVAVREIDHEQMPIAAGTELAADTTVQRSRQEIARAELKQRLESADVVVCGTVTAIQDATMAAAGGPAAEGPVSEHNPEWREAVIEVTDGLKGAAASDHIIVRFPSSMDVAFRRTPKLHVGQQGTFILRKDKATGTPHAMLSGKRVDALLATTPGDVLLLSDVDRVRALLKP